MKFVIAGGVDAIEVLLNTTSVDGFNEDGILSQTVCSIIPPSE